jgi:hypothetical protein
MPRLTPVRLLSALTTGATISAVIALMLPERPPAPVMPPAREEAYRHMRNWQTPKNIRDQSAAAPSNSSGTHGLVID